MGNIGYILLHRINGFRKRLPVSGPVLELALVSVCSLREGVVHSGAIALEFTGDLLLPLFPRTRQADTSNR